jgi:exodeoxyribonuclease V alpha subunit
MQNILIKNKLLNLIDIHFANHICKLASGEMGVESNYETEPITTDLWLLAAFASYFANQGDSAFSLESISNKSLDDIFHIRDMRIWQKAEKGLLNYIAEIRIPELKETELIENREVVGQPGELKPLIFENGLFYLNRFYQYEVTVAEFIKKRVQDYDDIAGMKNEIKELFPEDFTPTGINWQKVAAMLALRSPFTIISGGPGTGKTTTVGRILTLMLKKDSELIIKMVAPTGKAADRLNESIRDFKERHQREIPDEILNSIPETAETIHRFIGINSYKPKYDKYSPAPIDLLVIDEASMVSLPLFAKTFEALTEHCRVILLGDKDQLMAVENGNVLKDITDRETLNVFSANFVSCVAELTDGEIQLDTIEDTALVEDVAIQLEYSWRFSDDSGIGELSKAVNIADSNTMPEDLLNLFEKYNDIDILPISKEDEIRKYIASFCNEHLIEYKNALKAGEIKPILASLAKFRILCAVNDGPFGVNEINQLIEKTLFNKEHSESFYHGRPILITTNDYRLNLMNGDVGIIIKNDRKELKACFPGGVNGTFREFNPASLGEHRTAFSISIHKSQGSEFDNVFILLPSEEHKILSKELIYTAITRAKLRCTIISSLDIFHQAAISRMHRQSGLKAKIYQKR